MCIGARRRFILLQSGTTMTWYFPPLAPAVAIAAALAFYPVRRPGGRIRTLAWLASSVVVALSPCLTPRTAKPLRFGFSLIAITLMVKLYDAFREPELAHALQPLVVSR